MRHHQTRTHRLTGRPRRLAAVLAVGGALVAGGITTASAASAAPGNSGVLARIKACESGGSYTAQNPSSSASGAYQFLTSTWRALPASAGYPTAASAPAGVQDRAAQQLFAQQGTSPWLASAACWRGGALPSTQSTTRSSTVTGTGSGATQTGDRSTASAERYGYESSTNDGGGGSQSDSEDHTNQVVRARNSGQWSDRTDSLQGGTTSERHQVNSESPVKTGRASYHQNSQSGND
ncbi:MAG: transglycosylase family protein [Terracoccus sp.]